MFTYLTNNTASGYTRIMVLVQKDFLLFFLLEVYNSMFFYYGRRQHILKRKKKKESTWHFIAIARPLPTQDWISQLLNNMSTRKFQRCELNFHEIQIRGNEL